MIPGRLLGHVPEKDIVRLAYFDEAGTGDIRQEPFTVVAAVIIHGDKDLPGINGDVQRLLDDLPPSARRQSFEFKANRMFRQLRKYENLMRQFLGIMRDRSLPICSCALHRTIRVDHRTQNRTQIRLLPDSTATIAFAECAMDVSRWAREHAPDEGVLCIADQSRRDTSLRGMMRSVRGQVNLRRTGTERRHTFDNLIDSVHIGPSDYSVGLQMADYANFFCKTHLMGNKKAEPFYEIIASFFTEAPQIR